MLNYLTNMNSIRIFINQQNLFLLQCQATGSNLWDAFSTLQLARQDGHNEAFTAPFYHNAH